MTRRAAPERCRLLYGPYPTPGFSIGDEVLCATRGPTTIPGVTAARIAWPVGKRGRNRALVLYGSLVDAVRRESAQAVAYWWGVGADTVWRWRKALGVGAVTDGTRELKRSIVDNPGFQAGVQKAHGQSRDAELDQVRRAKIREAHKGKVKPRHVVEAIRRGRTGKPQGEETRARMSAAHKARGTLVPGTELWTAEEDDLVRTLPSGEAAARTGRTLVAVYARRRRLGLVDGRRVVRGSG